MKAMSNTTTCSFHFTLFFDSYGYYIWWNSGNVIHYNHMLSLKDIPLSEEERNHVGELANAYTQPAAAQNYFFANSNHVITPA